MRVVPMRTKGGERRPRRLRGFIGIFAGGMALLLLLTTGALAQSPSVTVAAAATTSTDVSAGTVTTAAADSSGTVTTTAPQAPAATAGLIPPVAGRALLNPGWKTAQMVVQVWPEYDKNAVLVIMDFELPADVPLPATFKFAVPSGAVVAGIGEVDPKGNFTFNYANTYPPIQSGTDWDIVTIQVQKYRSLQIDYYYDPGLPVGAGPRSFPLLLQLPLDVTALNLHVQQPARATDFTVKPALQGSGAAQDGFTYAVAAFSDVKAGSTFGYLVSYNKPDGDLSISTSQATGAKLNTSTVLLAVILVIVVCIGGAVIYFLFRRGRKPTPATGQGPGQAKGQGQGRPKARPTRTAPPETSKAKKPAAQAESAVEDADETAAGAADTGNAVTGHCPACGEELIKNARFCPNCGEAQGR
jgi:zinc-ribbon domain